MSGERSPAQPAKSESVPAQAPLASAPTAFASTAQTPTAQPPPAQRPLAPAPTESARKSLLEVLATAAGLIVAVLAILQNPTILKLIAKLQEHDVVRDLVLLVSAVPVLLFIRRAWGLKLSTSTTHKKRAALATLGAVVLYTPVVWLMYEDHGDPMVNRLFPSAQAVGGCRIRTYGTNGRVDYAEGDEDTQGGPNSYIRITLFSDEDTEKSNAGLAFFFNLRGVDLSRYKGIRVWIRGHEGDEPIGMKLKDVSSREVAVMLKTLPPKTGLRRSWTLVQAAFEEFGNVAPSAIDNFSFYTTGAMAGTRPRVFYLGGVELYK